jgi:hypothetical protein
LETRIIKPEKREKNKQKFTTQNSSKKLQKTIKDLLNNEDLEMEVDLPTGIDEEDDNSVL